MRLHHSQRAGSAPPDRAGARSRGFFVLLTGLWPMLIGPLGAAAESGLVLDFPAEPSRIAATTFDEAGGHVGQSSFELETTGTGHQKMKIDLAITNGGFNRSEATLESMPNQQVGTQRLRLIRQRSQATRSDGVSLDLLVIDHRERRVSCYAGPEDESAGRHLGLPVSDRVVNVPLQLLFRPLARGEVDSVQFQLAMCKGKPVLKDMIAVRGPRSRQQGRNVIEVRYGPDFGEAVAFFASRLLPRFSFWFEPDAGSYLGHRMPLHRKGPNVLLLRQGMEPVDLGIAMR